MIPWNQGQVFPLPQFPPGFWILRFLMTSLSTKDWSKKVLCVPQTFPCLASSGPCPLQQCDVFLCLPFATYILTEALVSSRIACSIHLQTEFDFPNCISACSDSVSVVKATFNLHIPSDAFYVYEYDEVQQSTSPHWFFYRLGQVSTGSSTGDSQKNIKE